MVSQPLSAFYEGKKIMCLGCVFVKMQLLEMS